MTWQGWFQIAFYLAVLTALVPLLGGYMARVYMSERVVLQRMLGSVERLFYRAVRTNPAREQDWKQYATTMLVFSVLFWLVLYAILRAQGVLLFNPLRFSGAPWNVTFNTTSSFISNTNWQTTAARRPCRSSRRWSGWRCRTSSRPRSAWPCWPP
jgi:potassium-transporting ATPase potassium-binding subunit